MVPETQIFYVNGYGVPKNVFTDKNYLHYVQYVVSSAETADAPVTVYFAGGATDPAQPGKTEAGEMERLAGTLLHTRYRDRVTFRLITEATDLLGNFRAFVHRLPGDVAITVFCEHTRQDRVRFLCWRMLPEAIVVPVQFNKKMMFPLLARLRELPNTVLLVGGWLSPTFKRLVADPLRARHMRRDSARRHARSSP